MDGQETYQVIIRYIRLRKKILIVNINLFFLGNLRPSEINASIGIEQLKKLNKMIKIRRENLKTIREFFW